MQGSLYCFTISINMLRGSRTIRKEKIVAVAEDIDLGHDELLL